MRFVYITATDLRHTAFITYMQKVAPPCLIVREPKAGSSKKVNKQIIEYNNLLQEYEKKYFTSNQKILSDNVVITEPGQVNNEKYVKLLREAQPDIILVFGASLLKSEILKIPKLFSLNIHTGITQLFRGVDSYFWAIHDKKPEGIGATVHHIDLSIDAGNIVLQGRPELSTLDELPDLFFKSILTGFQLMEKSVNQLYSNSMKIYPLKERGKLYQVNDFTEKALEESQANLKQVLVDYLNH